MQPAFESIQSAAVRREHQEAVADGNVALAQRIRTANPDLFDTARVLVEIRGGVAYVAAHGNVKVSIVDYDNFPEATIPVAFRDLDANHDGIFEIFPHGPIPHAE